MSISFTLLYAELHTQNTPHYKLNDFIYETPTSQGIKIPKGTKLIIIAFEKEIGVLINDYLDTQGALYLQEHKSIFIVDAHKMPKFIINMVALPKLQKYKHPIYLYYGNEIEATIPKKEAKATLLYIEDEKIKEIKYIHTKEELKMAIER
ncbi:MAG TPA: hypothetical protein VLZ29_04765 [Sulfurimonas sp.]|uniref:hypothetical protein n=1 Tax=Sulfurimonas sp. TaxID=2022749 RepID=UPI002B8AD405|nr:hypothetical protein [Sulfurimonas sp.]HUH42404.1 hypothetical protein [Sulfurimonas sp.]